MRIAGVRLCGRRLAWIDAGDVVIAPVDRVEVRVAEGDVQAVVYVTPEQLGGEPPEVEGLLLRVLPAARSGTGCDELPGADLPPLGSTVATHTGPGTVTGVDAVNRTVTVALIDGSLETVSLADVTGLPAF